MRHCLQQPKPPRLKWAWEAKPERLESESWIRKPGSCIAIFIFTFNFHDKPRFWKTLRLWSLFSFPTFWDSFERWTMCSTLKIATPNVMIIVRIVSVKTGCVDHPELRVLKYLNWLKSLDLAHGGSTDLAVIRASDGSKRNVVLPPQLMASGRGVRGGARGGLSSAEGAGHWEFDHLPVTI